MAEETQQTEQQSSNDVIEALRVANAELSAKAKKRKEEIEALQAEKAAWGAERVELTNRIHEMSIEAPLKALAQEASIEPELFLENLRQLYRIEQGKDGKLALLSLGDGKPVTGPDGKPVPLEWKPLLDLLTNEKHPRSRFFSHVMISSKASGGNATPQSVSHAKPKAIQFGLR